MSAATAIIDKDRIAAMRDLAQWYHELGPDRPNLAPLGDDKRPVVTGISENGRPWRFHWQEWQETRQTESLWRGIRSKAYWSECYGVALVNGFGGWINIDIDSRSKNDATQQPVPRSVAIAFLTALNLPEDYPWLVQSPTGGWHIYTIVDSLDIDKGKLDRLHTHPAVDHVELRYKGHYTALPGSLHPNGKLYTWANAQPTETPTHVDGALLLAAYLDLTHEKPKPAPPTRHSLPSTSSHSAYVAKAVAEESARVSSAAAGSRNDTLNAAAFSLGTLVGAGVLTETDAEATLLSASQNCGLNESEAMATIASGLESGKQHPRQIPEPTQKADESDWIPDLFAAETPDHWGDDNTAVVELPPHVTWPYAIDGGRLVYQSLGKDGEITSKAIADFYAVSVEEIQEEEGGKVFVLEGKAIRGGTFHAEVPAEQFGDDRALRKIIAAAAGSLDGVYARMSEHLRPAIQRCSPSVITRTQRFRRTGWANDHFLLPGRANEGVVLALSSRKLPYGFTDEGSLDAGLMALRNLLDSVGPQYTTPILAQLLLAPLRRCVPQFMARPGLFIEGRTGSFKTTVVQVAMCLYGPHFLHDDALLKWGEGATRNAIMALASMAMDMPILVDNYKPNTGDGSKGFVTLVHNISEGTDKQRLDVRSDLRPASTLHCLPIYTGEDIPDDDSGALSRLLLVRFPRQSGEYNTQLDAARQGAVHLQSIGAAWIDWLEDPANRKTAAQTALATWAETYDKWRLVVLGTQPNVANAPRIITNLTIHELTWRIAGLCPAIAAVIADYATDYQEALQTIATAMATRTTAAVDGSRFLSALRELITSGGAVLMERKTAQEPLPMERDRMVGWFDEDGVYLLPELAIAAVKRLLGHGSIPVSAQALYSQLEGLGVIAGKGKDRTAKVIKVQGTTKRVLHLKANSILSDGTEDETPADFGL